MVTRVLLVDDHQIVRDGLRAILEREPDTKVVGEAGNGRDAVAAVPSCVPEIVVMDLGMPDLNGIEATRQIASDHPTVRVIALSTYSNERYVMSVLEAGAKGYVLKAAAHDELLSAIRAVRRGEHYLSPAITGVVVGRARTGVPDLVPARALAPREREVLQLVAEGRTTPEIAGILHLSVKTVESHRRNLLRKLGLRNVAELTKYAIREGITALDD